MARKQVALARSVDLGSLKLGLAWIFLAFSLSLSFVAALASVTMGTVTSAAAQVANVKNRVAEFLMCLSYVIGAGLRLRFASTKQMSQWKSNQLADFGSDHHSGAPKKRTGLGQSALRPIKFAIPIRLLRSRRRICASADHVKATAAPCIRSHRANEVIERKQPGLGAMTKGKQTAQAPCFGQASLVLMGRSYCAAITASISEIGTTPPCPPAIRAGAMWRCLSAS